MSSVFHYTNATGLLGMLSTGSLYATDYRYMNDPSEGSEIQKLMLPVFEAEVSAITPKLIAKKWLKKEFYDEHGVSEHKIQAEMVCRSLVTATDHVSPFFVISFCRHDEGTQVYENGLLSQWRGYAGGGGFAVEFDEEGLDALMRREHKRHCYAGFRSADVLYENYEGLFDPKPYEGVAGEMIWQLFESSRIDVSEVTGRKSVDPIILEYAKVAPFLKHWGFREEREYRMVGICVRSSKIPKEEKRPAKQIKVRARGDNLVPYIELFSNLDERLPIKSIVVGPDAHQTRQQDALLMLLEAKKINASVRLSKIPYKRP